MSKNIKEIGKELLGKSLNSFHRKTGLTQLEKNNEMQDGILNGILSQVDDAYIEKTEQSNVIHLEGSGDGVIILDSIEGNTLVNLWEFNNLTDGYFVSNNESTFTNFFTTNVTKIKPNQKYTFVAEIVENTLTGNSLINFINDDDGAACFSGSFRVGAGEIGVFKTVLTTKSDLSNAKIVCRSYIHNHEGTNAKVKVRCILIEGEHLNKEINYFTGLQSSFEEKVNDQGKYKIEILSHNKNILDVKNAFTCQISNWEASVISNNNKAGIMDIVNNNITVSGNSNYHYLIIPANLKKGVSYYLNYNLINAPFGNAISFFTDLNTRRIECLSSNMVGNFILKNDCKFIGFPINSSVSSYKINDLYINVNNNYGFKEPKQNKIKLLLDEPLRGLTDDFKDKLLVKDNKLVIERNCGKYKLNSKDVVGYGIPSNDTKTVRFGVYWGSKNDNKLNFDANHPQRSICNILPYNSMWNKDEIGFYCDGWYLNDDALRQIVFRLDKNIVGTTLNSLKNWIDNNEVIVIYKTLKPTYEEVLNEYGEPILLEGYENGTIYIDSTIVPTTTVRYTPKMESFKTLKEVNNNNVMLANDINDNIIPYMMDVDLMIMEKEMALMSHKNIRTIGVKDMTSMQKRTQDMLTRLIKGKTLTEQECKTRVTTYLNAGKITDEQAEELNFLIDEIYA